MEQVVCQVNIELNSLYEPAEKQESAKELQDGLIDFSTHLMKKKG